MGEQHSVQWDNMSVPLPVHSQEQTYALAGIDKKTDDVLLPTSPPRPYPHTATSLELRANLLISSIPSWISIGTPQGAADVERKSDNIPPEEEGMQLSTTTAYVGRRSDSVSPALSSPPISKFHQKAPSNTAPLQCSRCGLRLDTANSGFGVAALACPRCSGQEQKHSGDLGAASMPGDQGRDPAKPNPYSAPLPPRRQSAISQYPPQQYDPHPNHHSRAPHPRPHKQAPLRSQEPKRDRSCCECRVCRVCCRGCILM